MSARQHLCVLIEGIKTTIPVELKATALYTSCSLHSNGVALNTAAQPYHTLKKNLTCTMEIKGNPDLNLPSTKFKERIISYTRHKQYKYVVENIRSYKRVCVRIYQN